MGGKFLQRWLALLALIVFAQGARTAAQELQRGAIVDRVECASDPAQTYALYLPSAYSPERQWSLLLAFHPAARGRAMVEKYQAGAEQYGYIVAASNNSRNGPYAASIAAAQAMVADVSRRFSINPQRVYLTGMSGGARVATGIALGNKSNIAGVIASSAGYPDAKPREKLTFAVFGTAGTEDFNYLEMRLLDRKLSSPHFLAVFRGGHTLPPDAVAFDAVEWMELQAMQSGRRPRDAALASRILERRKAKLGEATEATEISYLLAAIVSDFNGLADISAESRRLEEMSKQSEVKKAIKREQDAENAEGRMLGDIFELEARLADDGRQVALMNLRDRLSTLARKAAAEADTSERSQARRVLRSVTAGASSRVQDREYLKILEEYRQPGR